MTQTDALNILKMGHNVFLTGMAGAGKTFVLNQYIEWLKDNSIPVAITASTGIAATHIGGTTLHSFAGLEIYDELDEKLLDKILQKQTVNRKVNNASVLIIDEVSMLRSTVLDAVNVICQRIRHNSDPFGGLQIILCGDFFQLPPVITNRVLSINDYAFSSSVWKTGKFVICYLTENHRQADNSLSVILNNIRSGELDYDLLETLNETIHRDMSGTNHVKLYSHNADVDNINIKNYAEITDSDEHEYYMTSMGNKAMVEKIKSSCLSPEVLRLKKGTKVMFTRNDKFGKYNNGTIGEVIEFAQNENPIILLNNGKTVEAVTDSWRIEEDGKVLAQISQIPLRYAWAITIHKSQGMTLDAAEIDLSKSFGFALGYVALSRVREIEGIKLLGANNNAFQIHPHIHKVDADLQDRSTRAAQALTKYNNKQLLEMQNKFTKAYKKEKKVEVNTFEETKKYLTPTLSEGEGFNAKSLEEIAKARDLTVGTIITHLEVLLEDLQIKSSDIEHLIPKNLKTKKVISTFEKAIRETSSDKLTPIKKYFEEKGIEISFDDLRILRLTTACH